MSRRRRLTLAAVLLLLAPWGLLALLALFTPLPPQLRHREHDGSTRILDRNGRLLRHARASDGTWMQRASLDQVGPFVPAALLAAEDQRFHRHPGIDPLAMARAAGQLLAHRRIVSGASTLTQQLARTLVPRPRTFSGKIREMALALRIEASLDKRTILEEYLTRISFGPALRGVEAAARAFFDKPARELSLAEAALLAGMPQSPTYHDPRRDPERARRRRDRVLLRMRDAGLASPEQIEQALREPISLTRWRTPLLAPHFLEAILTGPLSQGPASEITSTLDPALQRTAEEASRRLVDQLAPQHVTAASVIVLDNQNGDILAYVGSPSYSSTRNLGANDGVLARRQPGSSLKPFVYQLALERLSWTPATLLPDVEISFPARQGVFLPRNYDGKFHGPVRLREALASSLNIPAVWTASRLGPEPILERLLALGFRSLDRTAEHYGVAIALGDGEVTLLELAQAYATLARGGRPVQPRSIRKFYTNDGQEKEVPVKEGAPLLDGPRTAQITDILADPKARMGAFGTGTVLDFPFPVAAKTGTSKGFRDNITAGYTREVTVAVWVGNFDGRPMQAVSGITGAGPLFHEIMEAAMQGRTPAPLLTTATETHTICELSGAPAGPDCPHTREERFLPEHPTGAPCTMHRRLPVDRRNGLLAGTACAPDEVEVRRFEVYPEVYQRWARAARRPIPPGPSPRCPEGIPTLDAAEAGPPRIVTPADGALFLLDRHLTARQEVQIRIDAPSRSEVTLLINGEPTILRAPPFEHRWPLRAGTFTLQARSAQGSSEPITVRVEGE
ncbi:MAG: penicillin-binding protein 1C [Polyangiaceae bacterium]|nr:penicillin-binding protein 1C [Polyangiaceae bacterium]